MMANCGCNIATRLLSPGVFNVKQFLNNTETMRWTVSSRICGDHDLNDYDAFLVLQKGDGEPDEVALSKVLNEADENGNQTITLTWNVGTYATWLTGYVKYQIVFRGSILSGLGVIGCSTTAANGSYAIDSDIAVGTGRAWTNADASTYKINYDTTNSRWQLVNGDTVVDYQTFADAEPCCGTWGNILVGNNTACVWESLEAVMFISDSIAADEHVSAKCPTILRQMWHGLRNMIIRSGATIEEKNIVASDWTLSSGEYYINVNSFVSIPVGCTIAAIGLMENNGNGTFTNIGNTRIVKQSDGTFRLYSLENIAGKLVVTIKGGNGYFVPGDGELGELLTAAYNSASSAEASASSADASAASAATSADSAEASASLASASADSAAASADSALSASSDAAAQADAVITSVEAAAQSATEASQSATAAYESEGLSAEYAAQCQGIKANLGAINGSQVNVSAGTISVEFNAETGEYWADCGTADALTLAVNTSNIESTKSYYFDIKIASTAQSGFALTLPSGWIIEDTSCSTNSSGRYVISVHYDAFARLWNANIWKLQEA